MRNTETIAAISTALGEGGIGIVRISGNSAFEIADRIYRGRKRLSDCKSHTIRYGHIYHQDQLVDEVLAMLMRAPHSFTGEDVVELQCHGGIIAVQQVLDAVLFAGAALAEPGEFTKRAFLNGKLDLSQAEAVIDVIEAKNNYALSAGLAQLKGRLKDRISDVAGKLLQEIAFIEAALDDPEHYSLDGYPQELKSKLEPLQNNIEDLIQSYADGLVIREGIQAVILGRPNAGKSSVLNLLSGKQRAIVADIAGTTRDMISEDIRLSGVSLCITDTAGIRDSEDIVEQTGVNMAKDAAKNADLILYVIDACEGLTPEDEQILDFVREKKVIILWNKSDLDGQIPKLEHFDDYPRIIFSAKEGSGKIELEQRIKEMFFQRELAYNDQVYITNRRHRLALEDARDALIQVAGSIENGLAEDFFSIDLLLAYESLLLITGETVGDNVIQEIFARFCTGK